MTSHYSLQCNDTHLPSSSSSHGGRTRWTTTSSSSSSSSSYSTNPPSSVHPKAQQNTHVQLFHPYYDQLITPTNTPSTTSTIVCSVCVSIFAVAWAHQRLCTVCVCVCVYVCVWGTLMLDRSVVESVDHMLKVLSGEQVATLSHKRQELSREE